MDREAWRAAIHGVTKSQTWLSNWTDLEKEKALKTEVQEQMISPGNSTKHTKKLYLFFLDSSKRVGEESTCNAEDTGDASPIPGIERSPGGGNGNPLQYSCLKNLMDRGIWQATVQMGHRELDNLATKHKYPK